MLNTVMVHFSAQGQILQTSNSLHRKCEEYFPPSSRYTLDIKLHFISVSHRMEQILEMRRKHM
jgi:hypothetical protein